MEHKTLLVSNRGEIACRIFQAAKELNLNTVGIFTKEDFDARHITFADQVFEVKSYLDIQSILEAAKNSKATLIHPGYGFLSERPAFVQSVEKAGLVFLGPDVKTMNQLGEKTASKKLAEKSNIPTLPWAETKNLKELESAAKAIGFPLLLKASAGGGGKGMRKVESIKELKLLAENASMEAKAAFGDGTLFIEKFLENPRHIEAQIFGDGTGKGIHLFERECSLQRRHQKIWEEAPAPYLSEKIREGIFEAALKLVHLTKYRSAGTVEFLVDQKGNYYFLEMNTRLQVEHPVTEWISGIDLVHEQIKLALNQKNYHFPDPIYLRGHSIEVRLYAEDPAHDFIPTPGKVIKLNWPTGHGIRVDSGIEEGQNIITLFDSMLGKLIVWGTNRENALARLRYALDHTLILGVGTNQAYLRYLSEHPRVVAGKVDTDFLNSKELKFSSHPLEEELSLITAFQHQITKPPSEVFESPWKNFPRSQK